MSHQPRKPRNISVRLIPRKVIDYELLARALIALEREQQSARAAMGVTELDASLPKPRVDGLGGDAEELGDTGQRQA